MGNLGAAEQCFCLTIPKGKTRIRKLEAFGVCLFLQSLVFGSYWKKILLTISILVFHFYALPPTSAFFDDILVFLYELIRHKDLIKCICSIKGIISNLREVVLKYPIHDVVKPSRYLHVAYVQHKFVLPLCAIWVASRRLHESFMKWRCFPKIICQVRMSFRLPPVCGSGTIVVALASTIFTNFDCLHEIENFIFVCQSYIFTMSPSFQSHGSFFTFQIFSNKG